MLFVPDGTFHLRKLEYGKIIIEHLAWLHIWQQELNKLRCLLNLQVDSQSCVNYNLSLVSMTLLSGSNLQAGGHFYSSLLWKCFLLGLALEFCFNMGWYWIYPEKPLDPWPSRACSEVPRGPAGGWQWTRRPRCFRDLQAAASHHGWRLSSIVSSLLYFQPKPEV